MSKKSDSRPGDMFRQVFQRVVDDPPSDDMIATELLPKFKAAILSDDPARDLNEIMGNMVAFSSANEFMIKVVNMCYIDLTGMSLHFMLATKEHPMDTRYEYDMGTDKAFLKTERRPGFASITIN